MIDFDNNKNKYKKTFKKKYHIVHSSGSTGKPAYFVYDNKAWESMLIGVIRAALWDMSMPQILKYLFKKPRILYIAATDGRYGGAMAVGDGIKGVKGNQLFIDINMPLKKWIEKTKHFRPDMIVGYPSAIKILGELVESGKLDVNVFRVISCGEPLNNNLRQYFKKVFHSDVINFYGASESLVLGVEADFSEGMYLFDDMNYIEVENGNMYVTSLYNYVQPLIRYQITDRLKIKKNNEKHPFIRAENIVGREEDILWFENRGKKETFHIEKIAYHKKFVLVTVKELKDINEAECYKGATIWIPEQEALPLEENEYYMRDLYGLTVMTQEGEELGILADIYETGANDVYAVRKEGQKDLLIPAIKQCILSVDIINKKMIVELLEGLR